MTSSPNDDTAQRGWLLPIGVAVLAGLGAAGGTFALWSDQDTTEARMVSSGELNVTSRGVPTWQETSTDVADAPQEIDPATFLVRPGDSVAVAIPFATSLRGDNLDTELRVDWSTESAAPDGVTGTYTLVDAQGNPLQEKPLELGQAMEFAAVHDGQYTVEVDLDFAGLENRFGAETADPVRELGNFDIAVHQVRPGGGAS